MTKVETLPDDQRVVITGLGAVTPLGLDVPTTWANLLAGKSGISKISDVRGHVINDQVDIAGLVKDFDPERYLHPSTIRKTHASHHYAYAAAVEAGIDAGILNGIPKPEKNRTNSVLVNVDPERVGVIIGTGIGGTAHSHEIEDIELIEAAVKLSRKLKEIEEPSEEDDLMDFKEVNLPRVIESVLNQIGRKRLKKSPFYILRLLPERTASVISLMLGTQGDLYSPVAACASGVRALSEAYKTIKEGDADIIFAGGTEASIDPISILAFQLLGALSNSNKRLEAASRPFDMDSDGFVMSEGASVMVVESLSSAQKRNARIYAEILGYGNSSDAYHETSPHPDSRGAIRSMMQALRKANLEPADIDLINAHATSTGEADGIELDCYRRLLGDDLIARTPITAPKDRLGHMMGASGAIEGVISILTMRDSFIPAMLNLIRPRRDGFDLVISFCRRQEVNTVLKNSFGFGGINASIIFRKWDE